MQIPAHVHLSTLVAAQAAKAPPKPGPPAPAFASEAETPGTPAFEPLVLPKAAPSAKSAEKNAIPAPGPVRLGSQVDIKI